MSTTPCPADEQKNHEPLINRPGLRAWFIDKTGKQAVPGFYESASRFSDGLAPVELHGRWGYIDKLGNVVIDFQFADAQPFSEGLARASTGTKARRDDWYKYGYIDRSGKFVIRERYSRAADFQDGRALVSHDGRIFGVIDKTGKTFVPERILELGLNQVSNNFSEGLARVPSNGENARFGYMDVSGKIVIKPRFEDAGRFSEGLAPVQINGKLAFIDHTGKVVLYTDFKVLIDIADFASGFSEGLASVSEGMTNLASPTHGVFIDKAGNTVLRHGFCRR
ncbi:MAG TPA: WG repeat-containing protein [Blastocatellia bacterium]